MVSRTNPTSEDDEECSNGVANPDTDPCLPPAQTDLQGRSSNHPCIDVEAVGDPERDKVDVSPLSPCRLDGFQVVVGQEELLVG